MDLKEFSLQILAVLIAFAGHCAGDHGILMPPPVNSYGFPMTPGEQGHIDVDPPIDNGQIGGHAVSKENVYHAALTVSNNPGHEAAVPVSINGGDATGIDEYLLADIRNQVAKSGAKLSAQSNHRPTEAVSSNGGDDSIDFQVISALGEMINGYRKTPPSGQGDYPVLSVVDTSKESHEGQTATISYQPSSTGGGNNHQGHYTGHHVSGSSDGLNYGSSLSGVRENYNSVSIPNDYDGIVSHDGSVATAQSTLAGGQTTYSNDYQKDLAKNVGNIIKGQIWGQNGGFEVIYSPQIESYSLDHSQKLSGHTEGHSQKLSGHTEGHSQKLSGHTGGHSQHNGAFHVGQTQQNADHEVNQLQQISAYNGNHPQQNGGFTHGNSKSNIDDAVRHLEQHGGFSTGHSKLNIDHVVNYLQQDGGFNSGHSKQNTGYTVIQLKQNGDVSQGNAKSNIDYAATHVQKGATFNQGHPQQNLGYNGNHLQQNDGISQVHSQPNNRYSTGSQSQQNPGFSQSHSQQNLVHPENYLQQTEGHVFPQNSVEDGESIAPKNIAYNGGQASTHNNGGHTLVQGPVQHVSYTGGQISSQKFIPGGAPFPVQNVVQGAGAISNAAYNAPPIVIHHHEGVDSTPINHQPAPIVPPNIVFQNPIPVQAHPVSPPPSHNFNGYNTPSGMQFEFSSQSGHHAALSVSTPVKSSRPMQLEINPIPAVHRSISFVRGYLTRKLKALDSLGSRAEQMLSSIPVIQIEFSKDDKKS